MVGYVLNALSVLQVEAGDVIVRVNGTDVHQFTTKEGMIQFRCSSNKMI